MSTIFYLPSKRKENEWFLACGVASEFIREVMKPEDWQQMQDWLNVHGTWRFGWMAYNAGYSLPPVQMEADTRSSFPQVYFFVPHHLALICDGKLEMLIGERQPEFDDFLKPIQSQSEGISLRAETSKELYLESLNSLLEHIQQGDVYELNYCQIFSANERVLNPVALWFRLFALTEAPHAVYAQHDQWHILSASPERFIAREKNHVYSQPIKGTIRRGMDAREDELLREELLSSKKERAENIMIVDLVRNDLSRVAARGTVKVDELCGLHTFKNLHHLISTISCEVSASTTFTEIIQATFPMGSMTGAPKLSAMQLAARYEMSTRGVYSGTTGYITPDGDFDFNVVIRSILYDSSLPKVSIGVGGAITSQCSPEKEYEECMLKAAAMIKALETSNNVKI